MTVACMQIKAGPLFLDSTNGIQSDMVLSSRGTFRLPAQIHANPKHIKRTNGNVEKAM